MTQRIIHLVAVALMFASFGCESSANVDGKNISCAGLGRERVAGYKYEPSARNIIVGIVFVEVVAPPVLVVLHEYECPVAKEVRS